MELTPFFMQYEALIRQADAAFEKVRIEYPDCVLCHVGCADCCHALFDLTLVEAIYIKNRFDAAFKGPAREALIERANEADRKIYRLKRQAFKEHEGGRSEDEILEEMAAQKVRCPALEPDNRCAIYSVRPLTCRIYGVPTVIGGRAHTCGTSGFKEGVVYPTVKLDLVYQKLYEISAALSQSIGSRYPKLAEMLVPLSMALLTDYSEEFLGAAHSSQKSPEDQGVERGRNV